MTRGAARGAPTAVVLRALGLGDLLTAVPALRGLRAAVPGHRIRLAASAAWRPLVETIDAVDELVAAEGLAALPAALHGADLAVNLHGRGPQSHRLLQATGPRRLVAFGCPAVGVDGPPWRSDEHEVDRWCRLIRDGLGVGLAGPHGVDTLRLPPPSGDPVVRDAVVVHPGAASAARRWPADRYGQVAAALAADGHRVVVTGTSAERPLAADVAGRAGLPEEAVLAGRLDLSGLAMLVSAARLVVCGDTGVAHLATAYGRPSVVLFGPVSPALWGPPSSGPHRVLFRGQGDGDPHADVPDPALLRLDVPEVLAAARRQVGDSELMAARAGS